MVSNLVVEDIEGKNPVNLAKVYTYNEIPNGKEHISTKEKS
jgi:hypothetical protein